MKSTIPIILAVMLTSGCGSSDNAAPEQAATKAAPAPVVIDDTPVEPLQIGGTVTALNSSVDLSDPDLSLIHISEPTRRATISRMPSSA